MEAQEKEAETGALFQLTNRLTDAADISDIASITTDTISGIMNCRAACLCFDESGQPEQSFIQQQGAGKQVRRKANDIAETRRSRTLFVEKAAPSGFFDSLNSFAFPKN